MTLQCSQCGGSVGIKDATYGDDAIPDLGIGVAPKLERPDSPADGWGSDDDE